MPDKSKLRSLLLDAAERGATYRESLSECPVAPSKDAVAAVSKFVEAMPVDGTNDESVLAMLDDIGSPATMMMAGPRFFGFVIGGSLPVTVATNWLTTAWDQNGCMHEVTPATSTLERVAMDWMLDLFGLPADAAASFVTGATVANFTCLAAARNRVYTDIGWNVEADGLIGAPPITIIVSEETHPTVFKSLGLLGFGRNRVVRAPVDEQGKIDLSRFPNLESTLDYLRVRLSYHRSNRLEFLINLRYQRFKATDWALAGVEAGTIPVVLTLGADPYDDEILIFGLGVRYRMGVPATAQSE